MTMVLIGVLSAFYVGVALSLQIMALVVWVLCASNDYEQERKEAVHILYLAIVWPFFIPRIVEWGESI